MNIERPTSNVEWEKMKETEVRSQKSEVGKTATKYP